MNVDVLRYAAFTDDPASGNPAGVVPDAGQLTEPDMLSIAAGVGYSETAFITKSDHQLRRYAVRYFSPRAEVPFCGHATIATAVEITRRTGPGELMLDTHAGEVPVHTAIKDGRPWATLTSVPASSRPASPQEAGPALAALGWAPADLDPRFPVHIAYAGNYHLMLAAATRARLADLDYDFDALAELMAAHDWTTVHLFWAHDAARFHARDPFPPGGVVEDPATGAAAAAFGGYLRALGRITAPTRLTVRQGEDLGRPSELLVDVHPADEHIKGDRTGSADKPAVTQTIRHTGRRDRRLALRRLEPRHRRTGIAKPGTPAKRPQPRHDRHARTRIGTSPPATPQQWRTSRPCHCARNGGYLKSIWDKSW